MLLFTSKKTAYRVYFKDISKNKAKKIMNKFDLIGKTEEEKNKIEEYQKKRYQQLIQYKKEALKKIDE